jgi:hypothetical protein
MICSQCYGDGQSAGQTFTLGSPAVATSITFSIVPYIPGSGFISGYWGWPTSVTIGIYQAGNGVVGNQIYSATFTPAQFISDTPTSNRTELVTVDLGGGVLLPASGYDVFITNPTTLALSIYPNLGSGGLIWTEDSTSPSLTDDPVSSYLPITSTLLDTGLSISGTTASITIYINPMLSIATNGRTATLDQAKQQFRESWDRVQASPKEGRTRNLDTLAFQYARTRVAGCRRSFCD